MKDKKSYILNLPVYKQGDDLGYQIDKAKTLKEAFENQAELYKEAAQICMRMARAASEINFDVDADTHHIGVYGPAHHLDSLVEDDILEEDDFLDEFDEEDIDD